MSWRDALREASFRGVPFLVDGAEAQVGRRTVVHEYPQRDEVVPEDLGRRQRELSLDAFVLGANYLAERDRLRDAIEAGGAGVLIHPWWGRLEVSVLDASISESTRHGGMARFRLRFVEAGQALTPAIEVHTASAVLRAAAEVEEALAEALDGELSVAELPSDLRLDVVALVQAGLSALRKIKGRIAAALQIIDDVADAIADVAEAISDIIRSPIELVQAIVGIANRVLGAIATIEAALNALVEFFGGAEDVELDSAGRAPGAAEAFRVELAMRAFRELAAFAATAPSSADVAAATSVQRRAQLEASRLVGVMFRVAALSSVARLLTSLDFDTSERALAVRGELLEYFDALDVDVDIDDQLFQATESLRAALFRHLERVGTERPAVRQIVIEPGGVVPGLVLAHRLYQDARRELEIMARNPAVPHPGFLPSGVPLEVIDG